MSHDRDGVATAKGRFGLCVAEATVAEHHSGHPQQASVATGPIVGSAGRFSSASAGCACQSARSPTRCRLRACWGRSPASSLDALAGLRAALARGSPARSRPALGCTRPLRHASPRSGPLVTARRPRVGLLDAAACHTVARRGMTIESRCGRAKALSCLVDDA